MQTLVNCLDKKLEVMFDGQIYTFEPGDEITLMDDVARHLRMKSLISDNPVTGQGVFALKRKGVDDIPEEPLHQGIELLDRSDLTDPRARNVVYRSLVNPVEADGSNRSALDNYFRDEPKASVRSKPAQG